MKPSGAVLFVSDLHLAPDTPDLNRLFLDFLAGPARDATGLYILGDLFDAWAGDDDLADPFNARIVSALRALADSGVAIGFIAGNRDFLVGADFAQAAGLELLPDPCVRAIAGERVLLSHGDALCTDDADYQRFRAEVRGTAWRQDFLARPLAERKRLIAELRARSETEKQVKPLAIMDVNVHAVEEAFAAHGVQALVHGHTHRQGEHVHRVGGGDCQRRVLGDWHANRGNALRRDAAGWRWLELR